MGAPPPPLPPPPPPPPPATEVFFFIFFFHDRRLKSVALSAARENKRPGSELKLERINVSIQRNKRQSKTKQLQKIKKKKESHPEEAVNPYNGSTSSAHKQTSASRIPQRSLKDPPSIWKNPGDGQQCAMLNKRMATQRYKKITEAMERIIALQRPSLHAVCFRPQRRRRRRRWFEVRQRSMKNQLGPTSTDWSPGRFPPEAPPLPSSSSSSSAEAVGVPSSRRSGAGRKDEIAVMLRPSRRETRHLLLLLLLLALLPM